MSVHRSRLLLAATMLAPAAASAQLQSQLQSQAQAQAAAPAANQAAGKVAGKAAEKPAADAKATSAIQTVEVKGAATEYDPRRDDTAGKTVLNNDEIRKYGDDNVFDVLKRAPGVTVTGKTIRMRGLGAGYTQILVNGDRPPPGFSLDTLAPDQIERIEIVRAASAEFSMQAIAGTINIVLRKMVARPQRDLRFGVMKSTQSRNANASGTWADKVGSLSYFLNAALYGGDNHIWSWSADRFTDTSGVLTQSRESLYRGGGSYRGVALFPRLSWKVDSDNELNLSVGLQTGRNTWSGRSVTDNLAGSWPDPDYVESFGGSPSRQRMLRGEVNWVAKLGGGKLDVTVSSEQGRNRNASLNEMFTEGRALRLLRDWDTETESLRTSVRVKFTRSLFDGHSLATGLESSVQDTDEARDRREQLGEGALSRVIETFEPRITRLAGYVQDEWSIDKQLSFYLGARWEGVRTDSEASGLPATRSRNHVLSPVLQTLYKFPGASGRQLRLALTRTYKAPTVEQLTARRYEAALNTRFNADSSGNPALRPELANGIDVGYEHFFGQGALFSVSAARREIDDYIRTRLDLDADGRWVFRPINDGEALVRSLEAELKLPGKLLGDRLSGLDLRANFTRNWSRVSSVPGPDNRLDAQTPLSANLGADYRKGDLSLGASLAWQQGGWVRIAENQARRQQTKRDLDTYALWKLDARYQVRLSLSNLLGTDSNVDERIYQDASGTSRELGFQPGSRRVGLNLEVKL